MNTIQLNSIFNRDPIISRYFIGTFACDQLPDPTRLPTTFALCVNTDKSTSKYGGLHWQSIFVRRRRAYFFDSFGNPPKGLIRNFCMSFPHLHYNPIRHQSPSAITCGAYSVYHIHMQSRGRSFASVVKHFVDTKNDDVDVKKWLKRTHKFNLF